MSKYLFILFALCWCFDSRGQAFIHGKVEDATSGNPLAGATITVGNIQIACDSGGRFAVIAGKSEIKASFTGYRSFSLNIKFPPTHEVIIKLEPLNTMLKEVVVSTGYQTLPEDRATGSFAQVGNDLFNRRVGPDVLSRLEGVVPGLLFNNNTAAAASGNVDISIRGTSTLFAATQPLIVVDGFAYDGDINNINPNTVESITVLKDAAAASIWGVKSGNGVIVITTKHGIRNKPLTIGFNANFTSGAKPNVYYNPNFLNSNDFINYEQTLFAQGYYDATLSVPYGEVSPVVALLAQARAGTISAADATAQINAMRSLDVRNDIEKYFYRHSADQQYALDLSGGGMNSDYFISGGFDNGISNLVGNATKRTTLSTAYNIYPVKNLRISTAINYAQTSGTQNSQLNNLTGGQGYPFTIYPYAQLEDKNGNALPVVHDYASAYTDTAGAGKFYDWKYRPLDELHNADNTSTNLDERINLGLKYDFLKGFSLEAKYEYENQHSTTSNNYSDQTYYTRNLVNQFTEVDGSGNATYIVPQGGILQATDAQLTAQRGRIQADYHYDIAKNQELSVIAGSEINQIVTTSSAQTVYGYNAATLTDQYVDFSDYFPRNPDGSYAQVPNSQGLGEFTNRYISYYSNAGYTYDQRYTLSLSGRIDKSNLFGVNTNQKSVPLYSAGFAWDLSKEKFYNLAWLPYSKFRLTYGYNGNVDNQVSALTTFEQTSNADYTGKSLSVIVSPGNPDLRWEKIRMINLGYDFAIKNQLISGSFEYYFKKGTDIIGDSPLAPSTGFNSFRGNTADISGNGFDLTLNAVPIRSVHFNWQSNFLLSYTLDKVSKYDVTLDAASYLQLGDGNSGTIYPLTGKPFYAIYSYQWGGLTHTTGDPQGYLNGKLSTDYADIISSTTPASMVYNGPSRPTTFGSFRNTFSYDRLSLSANIIYKLNYYFRKQSINYGALADGWEGNKDFDQRWQKPGDELHTNVPSIQYPPFDTNRETFYEYSSALIDKGDNIRFQDIDISYDLIPPASHGKSPFSKLQLYAYINNVGILWRANHDGLDPDLYTGSLPAPRTLALGIKANLK